MDNLREARTYGGVGSILSAFGIFVPYVGIPLLIVGFVLEVLAVDKISSVLNEKEIFKNYLISIVVELAGVAIAIILGIAYLGVAILRGFLATEMIYSRREFLFSILGLLLLVLLVIWIEAIVAAIFLKKSFDLISKKLNVSLFSTAALLYLIGAVTSIVIVGFLIMFVANILKIAAYFNIPEATTQAPSSTQPSSSS